MTVAAWGGTTLAVELEVGGSAFTLDDPVLGTLDDGNVLGPLEPGGWVDVTCDATDIRWSQGAARDDGPLTRYEAGVADVVLTNADGRYSPGGAGVYGDRFGPAAGVRIRAAYGADPLEVLWAGTVESITARGYVGDPVPTATVVAVDAVASLNAYDPAPFDPPVGAGESLSARLNRILDEAAWPPDRRDIATGGPSMAPFAFQSSAWVELLRASWAGLWLIYVTVDGILTAAPQPTTEDPVPVATWGCAAGQAVVGDLELVDDVTRLYNIIDATGATGTVVTADDVGAVARYGPRRYPATLDLALDVDVDTWARGVLDDTSRPLTRIAPMTTTPAVDVSGLTWGVVLGARLGDVWRVLLPALKVDLTVWLRGWAHTVNLETWEVLYVTSPAPTALAAGPFTLDHDVLGVLDAGNYLN